VAPLKEVGVPDIGDFADVPIIEVLVAVGDTVEAEDPLVVLVSDKATMDVPAPALTYDHRLIDGADGARFCVHLAATLGDLRRALL
jgi:pyruvate/2-oxoglutarate dehydrogenase complex dihydrolipoamide acyltransferase (E2) component